MRQLAEIAHAVGETHEIIVVDDASEDDTAARAREAGAEVVSVHHRQIAATRNTGARKARGDILVFVDADTLVPPETFAAALEAMDRGAVGGGATARFRGRTPLASRIFLVVMQYPMRWVRTCGGCFLFTTREHFDAVGGFDERYFASEEGHFARALAGLKLGRFVVLRRFTYTSGRKVRMYSLPHLMFILVRIGIRGFKGFQTRKGMDIWYDGKREPAGLDD